MVDIYPFSSGQEVARTALPAGACDCHVHVYDAHISPVAGAKLRPPNASAGDYRRVQRRMGTTRTVLVTPSTYGANNTAMLTGLAQLGQQARGVAVIDGEESDEHLQQLHAQGVRGVRINLSMGVTNDAFSIARIAGRIAPLGWHLQLLMAADRLVAMGAELRDLPVDLVFDHMGRIPPDQCGKHPAHHLLLELVSRQRAWIKLSGGYLLSADATAESPDLNALACSYLDAAPERVIWGSDWPHPTASAGIHPMPDDARQVDRLAQWAASAHRLRQILVLNPERLYGFPPISES